MDILLTGDFAEGLCCFAVGNVFRKIFRFFFGRKKIPRIKKLRQDHQIRLNRFAENTDFFNISIDFTKERIKLNKSYFHAGFPLFDTDAQRCLGPF